MEVGHDYDGCGAAFRSKWGADSTEVGRPNLGARIVETDQSISGGDGSVTVAADGEFAVWSQRFSISSALRRTCSQ